MDKLTNIEEILENIDDMIDRAVNIPFNKKGLIDTDKLREYLDDIRVNMPHQIKEAQAISEKESEIISRAKKEAEAIVKKAEDRARVLITNEEVVKQAQAKANEIISNAQLKSKEIRRATNDYADLILKQTEEVLLKSLNDVKTTRNGIQQTQRRYGNSVSSLPSHHEINNK